MEIGEDWDQQTSRQNIVIIQKHFENMKFVEVVELLEIIETE